MFDYKSTCIALLKCFSFIFSNLGALSNMKEFFEHLQENVEALTKNEDGSTEEINPETGMCEFALVGFA